MRIGVRNKQSNNMATSNLTGNTYSLTDGNTAEIGFSISPNKACTIVAVVKSGLTDATTATIYDNAQVSIGTATFSGNTASFLSPVAVSAGLNYYVMTSGHVTRAYELTLAYPRARTDITYSNNAYRAGTIVTGIGEDANILDIQTDARNSNFLMHT